MSWRHHPSADMVKAGDGSRDRVLLDEVLNPLDKQTHVFPLAFPV